MHRPMTQRYSRDDTATAERAESLCLKRPGEQHGPRDDSPGPVLYYLAEPLPVRDHHEQKPQCGYRES